MNAPKLDIFPTWGMRPSKQGWMVIPASQIWKIVVNQYICYSLTVMVISYSFLIFCQEKTINRENPVD